jgi:hypothetical protein
MPALSAERSKPLGQENGGSQVYSKRIDAGLLFESAEWLLQFEANIFLLRTPREKRSNMQEIRRRHGLKIKNGKAEKREEALDCHLHESYNPVDNRIRRR